MTSRGAKIPKGFTAGKPPSMGGPVEYYNEQQKVKLYNISTELFNRVPEKDDKGKVLVDERGYTVYKVERNADGEPILDINGKPRYVLISPPIDTDGSGIVYLPPIGDYVEVTQNVADVLKHKTRTQYRPGHRLAGQKAEGMTEDPQLAEFVADAWQRGIPIEQSVAEYTASNLPDDVVRKLAIERGLIDKPKNTTPEELLRDMPNDLLMKLVEERGLLQAQAQEQQIISDEKADEDIPANPPATGKGKGK